MPAFGRYKSETNALRRQLKDGPNKIPDALSRYPSNTAAAYLQMSETEFKGTSSATLHASFLALRSVLLGTEKGPCKVATLTFRGHTRQLF